MLTKNKMKSAAKRRTRNCFKLPNKLILNQVISSSAKMVGALIYSYRNEINHAKISIARMTQILKCSENLVCAALNELERNGFITRMASRITRNGKLVKGTNTYICEVSVLSEFTFVPRNSLRRKSTYAGFALYLYLLSEGFIKGRAFPSIRKIRNMTGFSKSTIIRCVKCLERIGLIIKERCRTKAGDFACNTYFIIRKYDSPIRSEAAGYVAYRSVFLPSDFHYSSSLQFFQYTGVVSFLR